MSAARVFACCGDSGPAVAWAGAAAADADRRAELADEAAARLGLRECPGLRAEVARCRDAARDDMVGSIQIAGDTNNRKMRTQSYKVTAALPSTII